MTPTAAPSTSEPWPPSPCSTAPPSQRKPAWIRVKAPTSAGYHDTRRLMRGQGPAHGLRGGGLPEHRRVLGAEARDGDDPGRHLHPRLRLLQRQDRDAAGGRPARAGAPGRGRGHHGPGPRRDHLGRPRRPAGRRCLPVRALHRGDPRGEPGHHDRDPDPRLPAQAGCGRGDRRGPARRLQPQSRDRAAALPHRAARVRATSTRCACCSRSRSWTRPCSPSPGSWSAWARRSARSCR